MAYRRSTKSYNAVLKHLEQTGILHKQVMGVRNILHAHDGRLTTEGLMLPHFLRGVPERSVPENFHPGAMQWHGWVDYEGERAEITVTSAHPDWINTPCDVSSHFPVNHHAMDLLRQATTKWSSWNPGEVLIFGDAVLITENHCRWWFNPLHMDNDEILFMDENLKSPRTIHYEDFSGRPRIRFHEKPNEDDIMYLKLIFYNKA